MVHIPTGGVRYPMLVNPARFRRSARDLVLPGAKEGTNLRLLARTAPSYTLCCSDPLRRPVSFPLPLPLPLPSPSPLPLSFSLSPPRILFF
jgi:hypothetical protein